MHLDLAPYKISGSLTALGLCLKTREVFPAGESEAEGLTLFQITGNRLKPIFSHEMSLLDEQRGPGELTTIETMLTISDRQTSGHFDLLLVEHARLEKIGGAGEPETTRTRYRFQWRGKAYAAARQAAEPQR